MGKVLTVDEIRASVELVVKDYPVERVTLFGSYADGKQTAGSDIDLLITFDENSIKPVTYFTLYRFQNDVEKLVGKKVDVLFYPIPEGSLLKINKEVVLYGN